MSDNSGNQYFFKAGDQAVNDLTNMLMGIANPNSSGPGKASLADRFRSGGAAMAQGYDKFLDEQTRLQAAGKAGKFYFDANPEAMQEMNVTPEEAKNFGSKDWASLAQAHSTKQTLAQIMAKTKAMGDEAAANDFYANMGTSLAKQISAAPTDTLTGQPLTADPNIAALISGMTPQQQALIRSIGAAGPGNRGAAQVMVPLVKSMLASGKPEETIDNVPEFMSGPNGETVAFQRHTKNPFAFSPFTKADARVQEIAAQADSNAGKNLLPEGTEFTTSDNGFGVAHLPDGSMKILGRVPADKKGKANFFAQFMGGGTNAAPTSAAAPAKAPETKVRKYNPATGRIE